MCPFSYCQTVRSDAEKISISRSINTGCEDTEQPLNDVPPSESPLDFLSNSDQQCSQNLVHNYCTILPADPQCDYLHSISRHGRAILAMDQAQDIFRYKSVSFAKERDKAAILAGVYGVSVKTIRDIWVGRTWYRATFHLHPRRPFTPERLQKRAGRPKGAKDSFPRSRKHSLATGSSHFPTPILCNTSSSEGPEQKERFHVQHEAREPDAGCEPSVECTAALAQEQDAHPASRWLDFPTELPAADFKDPFHADWSRW